MTQSPVPQNSSAGCRTSSRFVGVLCLGFFDLLLVVNVLIMLLAWLLDPFRFDLGPMHLTVHGGLKPILVLVLILGVR